MKNVKTVDKGVGIWHQERDVYENSSKVTVYNLYEQTWEDLEAERLTHLFNNNKAEFEQRCKQWQEGIEQTDVS